MNVSQVSYPVAHYQLPAAPKGSQPQDGAEPPAAKALEGANADMTAALASISSGVDIQA